MGYMGLSTWGESDSAADFRAGLMDVFKNNPLSKGISNRNRAVRAFIRKEMKDGGNCYNTEGAVNIALVMEDEGDADGGYEPTPVFSKLLTRTEFRMVIKRLNELLIEADGYVSQERWDGSDNVAYHKAAYQRLKDHVLRKSYKE